MQIDVSRLSPEGEMFRGEEQASVLEMDREGDPRPTGPVRYEVTAYETSGELVVKGRLGVEVSFSCRKCGKFFTLQVEEPRFERVLQVPDTNTSVDLTPEMREAMILAFPNYPECCSGCLGLCPQCGKDLNTGQCGCEPPPDVRWGELDRIELG